MTIIEASQAIEAETHSRMWSEATPALRILVIKAIIEQAVTALPPEEDAKKVIKRKPRKAKAAPLTQHAEGAGEYAAKLSGQLVY